MICIHCKLEVRFEHGFWRDGEDWGDGYGGDSSCSARPRDPVNGMGQTHVIALQQELL